MIHNDERLYETLNYICLMLSKTDFRQVGNNKIKDIELQIFFCASNNNPFYDAS